MESHIVELELDLATKIYMHNTKTWVVEEPGIVPNLQSDGNVHDISRAKFCFLG